MGSFVWTSITHASEDHTQHPVLDLDFHDHVDALMALSDLLNESNIHAQRDYTVGHPPSSSRYALM